MQERIEERWPNVDGFGAGVDVVRLLVFSCRSWFRPSPTHLRHTPKALRIYVQHTRWTHRRDDFLAVVGVASILTSITRGSRIQRCEKSTTSRQRNIWVNLPHIGQR
jgi:hypothetical protein